MAKSGKGQVRPCDHVAREGEAGKGPRPDASRTILIFVIGNGYAWIGELDSSDVDGVADKDNPLAPALQRVKRAARCVT